MRSFDRSRAAPAQASTKIASRTSFCTTSAGKRPCQRGYDRVAGHGARQRATGAKHCRVELRCRHEHHVVAEQVAGQQARPEREQAEREAHAGGNRRAATTPPPRTPPPRTPPPRTGSPPLRAQPGTADISPGLLGHRGPSVVRSSGPGRLISAVQPRSRQAAASRRQPGRPRRRVTPTRRAPPHA